MLKTITNISGAGIVFREKNPSEIFIEIKDDSHPIKLVRRCLCLIGGSWIGDTAKFDKSPLDTFRREIKEELSFERPIRNGKEIELLGQINKSEEYKSALKPARPATQKDVEMLGNIKNAICDRCVSFGAFLSTITKAAMDAADPNNTSESFTSLECVFAAPMDEYCWEQLKFLQNTFGNLSNESISVITSLDKIIDNKIYSAFGYDGALQKFFLSHGFERAKQIPFIGGIKSEYIGSVKPSYEEYLKHYNILKKPKN